MSRIFNQDVIVLGDLTVNPANGAGSILTMSVTNVVTFRTPSEILSDIGALSLDQTSPQTVINGAPIFSGGIEVTDILFDITYVPTGTEPEGSLFWNEQDQTLDLVRNGTTLQLGQELYIRTRNVTGVTIPNGSVVYSSGHTGIFPDISLAQGNTELTGRTIGITTEDIANNAFGAVTTFGYVRGLKTDYVGTGAWGTTWVENDTLYLSADVPGGITNVEPSAQHHADEVGVVGVVHPTQGTILVGIQKHTRLDQLSDINGTVTDTNGQLVVWDNDNQYFDFTHNINDYFLTADTKPFKETVSTGIISGGALSINGVDNTKFDVAAGSGYIVDILTSPATVTEVTWGAFSSQTLVNLATSFATDIAIDINGDIVQQNSFTDIEKRSLIFLGGLDHSNKTNILSTFSIQVPMSSPASSLSELSRAIGDINLSGNVYAPNGANLSLDKSGGVVFSYGRNTVNDKNNPHKITIGAQVALPFEYVFNDGAGNGSFGPLITNINPDNYDDGTGILAVTPTNKWTIQRLLFFPNDDKTFIQYGTAVYNREEDALNAVPRADFPALTGIRTAMVRGYLLVKQGETDLTSTDTDFLAADRFGTVAGLDGGSSLITWGNITGTLSNQTDLQSALDLKANDANVVHLTGNESITGRKTFTNTGSSSNIQSFNTASGTGIYSSNSSTGFGIHVENNSTGIGLLLSNNSTGKGIRLLNLNGDGINVAGIVGGSGLLWRGEDVLTTTSTIDRLGNITGLSFIKTGGTASQFLKADGTVDSSVYLTSFTETDPVFLASPAGSITNTDITNWNTAFGWGDHSIAGYAIDADVVHKTGTETITGRKIFNVGSPDSNISSIKSTTGNGITSTLSGSGNTGIYLNNTGTGNNIVSDSSSTGFNYVGQSSGSNTFTVTKEGTIVTSGSVTASISALGSPASIYLTHTGGLIQSRTSAQVLSDIGAQASGNYLLDTTDTFTGTLTVDGALIVTQTARIEGSAEILQLKTDATTGNSYQTWHDAAGQKGFFGFAAGVNENIYLINEEVGSIHLGTTTNVNDIIVQSTGNLVVNRGSLTIASIAAETTDVDRFLVSNAGLVKYRTGAQVLSDIGGSSQTLALGTDNQIPVMNAGGTDFEYDSAFVYDATTSTMSMVDTGNTAMFLQNSTGGNNAYYRNYNLVFTDSDSSMTLNANYLQYNSGGWSTQIYFRSPTASHSFIIPDATGYAALKVNSVIADEFGVITLTPSDIGGLSTTGDGSGLTNVNATTLDSIDSSQFLRSDVADTKTAGNLTFNDGVAIEFGNTGTTVSSLQELADGTIWDLFLGDLKIRNTGTDRFTFGRTTGDLTITGTYNGNGSGLTGVMLATGVRTTGDASAILINSVRPFDVSASTDAPSATDGILTTGMWDSTAYGTQQFHDFHNNTLWIRQRNLSVWGAWDEILTTKSTSIDDKYLRSDIADVKEGTLTFNQTSGNLETNWSIDGAAVDEKEWDFVFTTGGTFSFRAVNDANSVASTIIAVNRTGTTIDDVTINGVYVQTSGKLWAGGAITSQSGSGAKLQVDGFQRTGNIYLHSGGLTPTATRSADYLSNTDSGTLQWTRSGINTGTIWHSGNDGTGSGLDADLWDGKQLPTGFASTSNPYTIVATDTWDLPVGGAYFTQSSSAGGPGQAGYWFVTGRRDTANGFSGIFTSYGGGDSFIGHNSTGGNPAWYKIWTDDNDGSGSGLDADLLDGQHGSYYAPASTVYTETEADDRFSKAIPGINIFASPPDGTTYYAKVATWEHTNAYSHFHSIFKISNRYQIYKFNIETAVGITASSGTTIVIREDNTWNTDYDNGDIRVLYDTSSGTKTVFELWIKVAGWGGNNYGELEDYHFHSGSMTTFVWSPDDSDTNPTMPAGVTGQVDNDGNLDMGGNAVFGGNVYSGSNYFVFGSNTGEGEYLFRTGNDIRIYAGGAAIFTVDGDNNRVGINNSSPSYDLDVTGSGRFTGDLIIDGGNINTGASQQRVKLGVWSDNNYGIGMGSTYTYGGLNDYAMTFQMNNTANRGWWWGHSTDTNGQGSMALTNAGLLTVASYTRIGYGKADTTTPGSTYMLQVNGTIQASDFIGSSDERLKENIKILNPKKIESTYKTFNFIEDEKKQERIGVIAQELEVNHPEFVRTDESGEKSVSYSDLHSAEIAYLKAENEELKRKIELIMNKLGI